MKDDPAGIYGKFLSEIRGMDSLSTEELAGHVNRWQSLKDSVFFYAAQDTSGNPHSDLYGKCGEIHDSLRTEFVRLARSGTRSYQDVFALMERTSPYCGDKELPLTATAFVRRTAGCLPGHCRAEYIVLPA